MFPGGSSSALMPPIRCKVRGCRQFCQYVDSNTPAASNELINRYFCPAHGKFFVYQSAQPEFLPPNAELMSNIYSGLSVVMPMVLQVHALPRSTFLASGVGILPPPQPSINVPMSPGMLQASASAAASAFSAPSFPPRGTFPQTVNICSLCNDPTGSTGKIINKNNSNMSGPSEFETVFDYGTLSPLDRIQLCLICYNGCKIIVRRRKKLINCQRFYHNPAELLNEVTAALQSNNANLASSPKRSRNKGNPSTASGGAIPQKPRCGKCRGTLLQKSSDRGWLCFSCDKAQFCSECKVRPLGLQQGRCDFCQAKRVELAQTLRSYADLADDKFK